MRTFLLVVATSVLGLGQTTAPNALTAVKYRVVDLWGLDEVSVYDMNARGTLVGVRSVEGTDRVFLYDGTFGDLNDLPGYPVGINSRNDVITRLCVMDNCRGFLWRNGQIQELTPFIPAAINDAGDVAGRSGGAMAIWEDGVTTYLPLAPLVSSSEGITSINNKGTVVGVLGIYYFRFDNTLDMLTRQDYDYCPPIKLSGPFIAKINNAGQTVGNCGGLGTVFGSNWMFWEPGEIVTSRRGSGNVNDLNDAGNVVGSIAAFYLGRELGFINQSLLDNLLIPDDSSWKITDARLINNAGQIIAVGTKDFVTYRTLRLVPVSVPVSATQ